MEQQNFQKKAIRAWREFAARYVSVRFAWGAIIYCSIVATTLLFAGEYFYYRWATSAESGPKRVKVLKMGITEKEIDIVKKRADEMPVVYESAKRTRFDVPEPAGYKAKSQEKVSPAALPVSVDGVITTHIPPSFQQVKPAQSSVTEPTVSAKAPVKDVNLLQSGASSTGGSSQMGTSTASSTN